jgi:tetratricopeptide (TPR) repeat protein
MNDLIRRQPLLLSVFLFAVVLWTFWPATHNGFVGYDDPVYVTGNGHVQQGLSLKNVAWAFTASDGGNWHPTTWFSHMADCQLFGLSPWGHHFVNVLFHALNSVLVFLGLYSLTQKTDPSGAGALWRSFIVAAFFGLHPLRVESVAWVAERKDVLSAFFALLSLLAYAKYAASVEYRVSSVVGKNVAENQTSNAASSPLWYFLSFFFFILGLMSKPMLVTLPFVLLLLDYWPLGRFGVQRPTTEFIEKLLKQLMASIGRSHTPLKQGVNENGRSFVNSGAVLLVEKVPFFAGAAILSVITIVVQRKEGAMSLTVPFVGRIANAVVSYSRYLAKTFFPHDLAFFYPYELRLSAVTIVSATLLLAAISVVAIYWRRERPFLFTGWFWFVGSLIPVIGLIQVGDQALADRYTYIPSIGLFVALVWSAHDLTRGWQFQRSFFGLIVAAVALIWALKTREQIGIWKSNETLFTNAIAVTPKNYIARNNLGATFERQGRWDEAAAQFRQAIADKPDYAQAHRNLGLVFERQGEPTRAIEEYREAMRLNPSYADPHNALGVLFNTQGRVDEALKEFQQALRLKPDYADAHFNLGLIYGRQGHLDEAIREYKAVLEVQPNRADVHNNLGVALNNKGNVDDAIREYVEAIELEPSYARARFNLGVALAGKGALAPAIEQFQEALRLKPDYKEARTNLDALLNMHKKD